MCGITGILSLDGSTASREVVEKMNGKIAHRGPDGQGIFMDGPIGLGHRRLSIIDLASGNQPMQSANGRTTIVFNGEIYNYQELRSELLKKNYPFQTHSDTEVILALYQLEGTDSFKKLAGMFAFAIWNRQLQQLVLARDRAGMKPLYYAQFNGHFVFASEIKAITAAFPALKEIETSALNFYFARQYIGGETTIFKGIKKLKPATLLTIGTNESPTESTYWALSPKRPDLHLTLQEATQRTDELLEKSVKSHLIADVPVGVFLSGGLDSSTILSYAAEHSDQNLHTFSVGFGQGSALNETEFARQLASHYNTMHHEIHVTEREVLDCLPHIIAQMDEPMADYAVLPTYVMSRFAAQNVKVVLSGEGADELFGGYKRYSIYSILDRLPMGHMFDSRLPRPNVFKQKDRKKLLSPGIFIKQGLLPQEQQLHVDKKYFAMAGHLNSILYTDQRNWLVDDLLMKVDKMGMLASLEARIPFLDHHLVEYIATINGQMKVRGKNKKILLRQVAAKRLPFNISKRQKHGFTVPVGEWLKGALRDIFQTVVLNDPANSEFFDLKQVEKLFKAHLGGQNYRLQLWSILVFCLWNNQRKLG